MTPVAYNAVVAVASRPRRLGVAILVVFLACSGAYGLIEHHGPVESMWWAVVTGSTVGYGDQYPETTAGRGVGAFLIISMVILVACATANLTARLIPDPHQFTDDEQRDVFERLDRIENLIRQQTSAPGKPGMQGVAGGPIFPLPPPKAPLPLELILRRLFRH
jgi:hypothetical protein